MHMEQPVRRSMQALCITAGLLLCTVLLGSGAKTVSAVVSQRIRLCLEVLIPSLFGCMAAANLLQRSGAAALLGTWFRRFGRLLHMTPEQTGIFLISQLAGYPVGALLLRQAAKRDACAPHQAARLSLVCFGGGPAFFAGLVGAQVLGSPAAGWAMLLSCFLANCLTAALLLHRFPCPDSAGSVPVHCSADAAALTGAVSDTVHSLAQICGIVLLFGIITLGAERSGLIPLLGRIGAAAGIPANCTRACTAALLDVTQIIQIAGCGLRYEVLLPLTAGLLSFGGICVHCQCLAVSDGFLSGRALFAARLFSAALAALLTRLLLPLLPVPEICPAFAPLHAVSRSGSVLPGFLILCTGFPFLIKKD